MAVEETSGFTLSITGDAPIYKGGSTINGTVKFLGNNGLYISSFSKALTPAGAALSTGLSYGNGVFYNAASKNNQVYAGIPTASGAVPVFAGVVARPMTAVQGAYPANEEKVYAYNKVNILKEGPMGYKSGINTTGTALTFSSTEIQVGAYAYLRNTDGAITFGSAATAAGFTTIGRIEELNPDDASWTVWISAKTSVYTA